MKNGKKLPAPKDPESAWGVYQWGRLWYVEHTKRDAIAAAVKASGEPWRLTKKYFEVTRVWVRPRLTI